ncbi:hypothetical protein ACJX0J_031244, partial [Zea mays]
LHGSLGGDEDEHTEGSSLFADLYGKLALMKLIAYEKQVVGKFPVKLYGMILQIGIFIKTCMSPGLGSGTAAALGFFGHNQCTGTYLMMNNLKLSIHYTLWFEFIEDHNIMLPSCNLFYGVDVPSMILLNLEELQNICAVAVASDARNLSLYLMFNNIIIDLLKVDKNFISKCVNGKRTFLFDVKDSL